MSPGNSIWPAETLARCLLRERVTAEPPLVIGNSDCQRFVVKKMFELVILPAGKGCFDFVQRTGIEDEPEHFHNLLSRGRQNHHLSAEVVVRTRNSIFGGCSNVF